jgi:CIC family chloride channel protein
MTASAAGEVQRLRLRDERLFVALSLLVGILAGLAAVLFTLAIDRADDLLFGFDPSPARTFLVPALVSVATGVLLATVFHGVRGSGVPQTKAAFHLQNGAIPAHVPFGKFVMGVLCIGCGHSLGREGPSEQIGAGIASVTSRWLGLSSARTKDLVAVGAAGALAAAFNTPIAAVLFALEEIIGDMNARLLGSTVVASVAAVVVQRSLLGNQPLFHVPAYQLVHPAELLAYAGLGVFGGLVSLLFCNALLALRRGFLRLPARTLVAQPMIGGVAIGAIILVVPEVRGVGYEHMDQALNGALMPQAMIVLCMVKIAATVVSYCSGNAGGIFAPTLFMGAMAGGAVGTLVHAVAPFPTAEAGAYALVGMGTLFAGIIRAPMTSVFMIFEITQDYQIIVPLMVANLLSFAISRRYQPVPVYEALLRQDGVHLANAALRQRPGWTARDVMNATPLFMPADASIQDAAGQMLSRGDSAVLVGSPDRLLGIVTLMDAETALETHGPDAAIASLMHPAPTHVHPDHALDVVLERLQKSAGVLPVVSRAAADHVEGTIAPHDITRIARTIS